MRTLYHELVWMDVMTGDLYLSPESEPVKTGEFRSVFMDGDGVTKAHILQCLGRL